MSTTEATQLDTPIARREMVHALERDLVVVLEKPGWTIILFADNRPALAIVPRDQPWRFSVTRASGYLGFSVSAKSYVYDDLGARAWYQL